jgi:aminopeptidase N
MTVKQGFYLASIIILASCNSARILVPDPLPLAKSEDTIEIRDLDTLVVHGDAESPSKQLQQTLLPYQETSPRTFDLLHTKLDLTFDWSEQKVFGVASLVLTPYFYPASTLILDAKDFNINKIRLDDSESALDFSYDNDQINITLDRIYEHGEKLEIIIDYTCTPSRGQEGSAAITSDQGLFFINPVGDEGSKPQQIWTQGETEFNSRWFPTIDKPNERSTQEVFLTVEDRFVTLSNGLLESSVGHQDGTRTDHWVMQIPHAPYLFMIAVGEFAIEKETWKGKELSYYVEPEYKDDAKAIFGHTPEMLSFFSEITGIEYPWQKYAQIVVRDYVSGAMENTTSVVFGEFVQKHQRELIDNHNDGIVAHEMFHHWFGDYVTCESWSNLTLNEGFANYAEYLWLEHKYGLDEAEHHRIEEIQGYLYQASQDIHPLIDFGYANKENMFDAHSYNKGGLVLHMLRNLVGDNAFFKSLHTYLEKHALSSVEVHDLRLAFEEVTGLDLNWFFNQWYLSAGHPEINFDYNWAEGQLSLQIEQTQKGEAPLFRLPTNIDIYYSDGSKERQPVVLDQRSQVINLKVSQRPAVVVFDPERTTLAVINSKFEEDQLRLVYDGTASLPLRTEALVRLAQDNKTASEEVILSALQDPFWAVRSAALSQYDWGKNPAKLDLLRNLAKNDKHSAVRTEAIYLLGEFGGTDEDKAVVAAGINDYDAYPIVAASIVSLYDLDRDLTIQKLTLLETESQSDVVAAISTIYGGSEDTTKLIYFEKHIFDVEGLPALDFYQSLDDLLKISAASTKVTWVDKLSSVATNIGVSPYTKISATRSMITLYKTAEGTKGILSEEQIKAIKKKIDDVIEQEENPQILSIYQSFMGS